MSKSNRWTVLVCALAPLAAGSAPALAQSGQSQQGGQSEFRVYDVSDLLPEEVRELAPVGMTVEQAAKLKAGLRYGKVEMRRTEPAAIAMDLAATLGVEAIALGPGVIGVLAEPADQEAFAQALDTMHDAFRDRAAVRIAVYKVDPGADIAIGSHPNPEWGPPIRQIQQAIYRRVPTPMKSVTVRRFISDAVVTTGTGGLGYQSRTQEVTEGLALDVRVGASNKNDRSLVDVQGELSRVTLRPREMRGYINSPNAGRGEAVGPIELPTVDRRPIHSAVSVRDGEETVIAVMDDPDAESGLVVTVRVSAVR